MKNFKFYEDILRMGRIFSHVLAYPDQNAEKSCKGGGGEGGEGEFARIEHAAKQQLKTLFGSV